MDLKMIVESEIIPYSAFNPPGDRILVLAPHPDDETFGALRLLSAAFRCREDDQDCIYDKG